MELPIPGMPPNGRQQIVYLHSKGVTDWITPLIDYASTWISWASLIPREPIRHATYDNQEASPKSKQTL